MRSTLRMLLLGWVLLGLTPAAGALTHELAVRIAIGEVGARLAAMREAVDSGDTATAVFLRNLAEGNVRVADGRAYLLRSGQSVDAISGDLTTLPASVDEPVINNRMRREIAGALGALSLFVEDRSERMAAAQRPDPAMNALFSPLERAAMIASVVVVAVLVPAASLALPAGHPLHLSAYFVTLLGKILCYAIVALAMGVVWGNAGILSLGHGLFFALGGYAMGMYLMRSIGRDGHYKSDLPDFMVFLDWKSLPWHWTFSDHFAWAMFLVVAVPGPIAFVFGWLAFRSRIKGVYFSIITQALTYAAMLLFFRNETGFGGNNGFTDFKCILGFAVAAPSTHAVLFALSGMVLIGSFVLFRWLVRSKCGRVLMTIRDAETRVMFCGYDSIWYKLGVWTLSAVLCGIAGAFLVNGAKSWFTMAFPEFWLYFLGLLFVLVTLLMPRGVVGLVERWLGRGAGGPGGVHEPRAGLRACIRRSGARVWTRASGCSGPLARRCALPG